MIFIHFLFFIISGEEPHFSTIASSSSSLRCRKCIYSDFLIHEKCHSTGYLQNIGNGTTIPCFPEDSKETIDGLKILVSLLALALFFTFISIWRKKVLLSR